VWNTEQDRLQMNVKVKFSSEKRGARLDPDMDLEKEVDEFVPRVITKRVLWRVAMGKYDPLGLLCTIPKQSSSNY
jgi:hypothetical protein